MYINVAYIENYNKKIFLNFNLYIISQLQAYIFWRYQQRKKVHLSHVLFLRWGCHDSQEENGREYITNQRPHSGSIHG